MTDDLERQLAGYVEATAWPVPIDVALATSAKPDWRRSPRLIVALGTCATALVVVSLLAILNHDDSDAILAADDVVDEACSDVETEVVWERSGTESLPSGDRSENRIEIRYTNRGDLPCSFSHGDCFTHFEVLSRAGEVMTPLFRMCNAGLFNETVRPGATEVLSEFVDLPHPPGTYEVELGVWAPDGSGGIRHRLDVGLDDRFPPCATDSLSLTTRMRNMRWWAGSNERISYIVSGGEMPCSFRSVRRELRLDGGPTVRVEDELWWDMTTDLEHADQFATEDLEPRTAGTLVVVLESGDELTLPLTWEVRP